MEMKGVSILPLLLAVTHSQMDKDFCAKRFRPKRTNDTIAVPPVYDDFFTSIEFTWEPQPDLISMGVWYSHTHNLLQRTYKSGGYDERFLMFPKKDELLAIISTYGGDPKCDVSQLRNSEISKVFVVEDPTKQELRIPVMQYMIPSTHRTPPIYIGKTTIRGIPAQEWFVCSHDQLNITWVSHIYFSDDGIVMPGSMGRVPLANAFERILGGSIDKGRFDFNMFVDQMNPKDKDLEMPSGLYCKNRMTANSEMPDPVDVSRVETVLLDLGDIKAAHREAPTMKYIKEVYHRFFSIFVRDWEIPASNTLKAYRSRLVHDFHSGLEYDINLSTGTCTVQKIPLDSLHDVEDRPLGMVSMGNPREFFSLTGNNFQYNGKHRHFDRDIEADVYTTVKTSANLTFTNTYWLATNDFLQLMGLQKHELVPLRYRSEMKNGDIVKAWEGDVYHFTTDVPQSDVFPDLSTCYSEGKEIYVDIVLKGHYKLLYTSSPDDFRAAFGTAMMDYSGIMSPIRMARFTVTPDDEGHTRVQFILLDKPSVMGDSVTEVQEPGNDVVWSKLKQSIENSQFHVSVHNDLGHHIAKAVRYGKYFQDPTTFSAKLANVKAASEQSSRFSPGSMAGIGIGMLLLGLLTGFIFMKGAKRYMDKVPDHIGMQEFKNET